MKPFLVFSLAIATVFVVPRLNRAEDLKSILADPERPAKETAMDRSRKPEEVLGFYKVKAGERVADLMAGRGYYTAILSRVIGPKGTVYSAVPKANDAFLKRMKKPAFANVKVLSGPMDRVELPSDGSLDFVLIHLNYHDLPPAVRKAMDRRVLAALKPGGSYGIVDHSAAEGTGPAIDPKLHRVDRAVVVQEVTAAGFELAGESDILRNPADIRTEPMFRHRGKTDRFVLRFVRPQ